MLGSLSLATNGHSPVHSPIGTPSQARACSDRLGAHGFRRYFTPLAGVLFTRPSRYSCTIGRLGYLALEGGPPGFPRDTTCPAVLTVPCGAPASSPTGLSPSLVARSSGVRLTWGLLHSVAGRPPRLTARPTPPRHRPVGHSVAAVWAPPRSLAATRGMLSCPRGTEMFQFPRFPPHPLCVQGWVSGHHPAGVAPFGDPRITACPRLPEAFRRLATSFVGPRRQGIHRVPMLWIAPARSRSGSPAPRALGVAPQTPAGSSGTPERSRTGPPEAPPPGALPPSLGGSAPERPGLPGPRARVLSSPSPVNVRRPGRQLVPSPPGPAGRRNGGALPRWRPAGMPPLANWRVVRLLRSHDVGDAGGGMRGNGPAPPRGARRGTALHRGCPRPPQADASATPPGPRHRSG